MNWKRVGVIGLVLLFSLFIVSCTAEAGPSLGDIWNKLLWFGSLGFLGENEFGLVGFMRILLVVLVFALLYEGSRVAGLSQNIGIVVSAILAIISVIFIPNAVLVGIGAAYATIVSIVFIGVPVVGGLLVFRTIPGNTRGEVIIRIIILLILLMILISAKSHATDLLLGSEITSVARTFGG